MMIRNHKGTVLSVFLNVIFRDLICYFRSKGECLLPLLFAVMIASVFSMVFPFIPSRLGEIAPTVLWIIVLLAIILSLENMFRADFQDGSLEDLILAPQPLSILVLAKITAHWLMIGLPLTLLIPCLAIPLQLPFEAMWALFSSVLIGVPILILVGAIAVALTLGLQKGGIFLAILILPLMMPVLILGTSAVYAGSQGFPFTGQLALLGAIFMLSLGFAPITVAAALKVGVH